MTGIPQAAIDAINDPDAHWPARADWNAAARTDGNGADARRKILLHGASLAAPCIVAAERERIARTMRRGFEALDNDTRTVLAAMFARWAAAMTDDEDLLGDIASLLDGNGGGGAER